MADLPDSVARHAPVPEAALRAAAAYAGDPWTPENPYFAQAEPVMARLWAELVHPFLRGCDFTCVLDLATGHGRNAAMLLPLARRLILVDIQPGNIAICRRRFGDDPRIAYIVNSGYDLREVPSGRVTLLYCFDAMVHFDSDVVRAYLAEARRVLAPGGRAFLHHSNYQGGHDWRAAPHSRAFMSQALMAHYARKEGLSVLRQQVMDWGGEPGLDCLSLLERG
ncbi:class I SAM-dependent methyltransferase [Crenalkalicoccus roseus]|uniref:class I SAM-dependent methyltransferase n=1 Tax=Crenalkalicoccus roseus TaxID=1485588 RepID=UPI00108098E9|nr:class I SAM-dependent methyltransferase [Crenalkalicoccus roseus]